MATINNKTTFSIGDDVELVGLQKSPHLNQRIGVIADELSDNGRYPVILKRSSHKADSNKIGIKPENLKSIDKVQCGYCYTCQLMFCNSRLQVCQKCHAIEYCSRECQLEDWKRGHKNQCKLFEQGRLARHDETKLPTDPTARRYARLARATTWQQKGKHVNAEAEYRAILQENPPCHGVYCALSSIIYAQDPGPERVNEAIFYLQKAVALPIPSPGEKRIVARCHELLGQVLHFERQDLNGAEQSYKEAIKLYGDTKDPIALSAKRGLQEVEKSIMFVAMGGILEQRYYDKKERRWMSKKG